MADFEYKPSAQLISGIVKKLGLTKDTCLIHEPTSFGDWRFVAIADYLRGELSTEDVWQLNKQVFRDGNFSVVSDDKSISGKTIVKWNIIPNKSSVLIFTNFSDLGSGGVDLWLEIGEGFREEGIRPKIITQLPPYKIDIRLRTNFDIYILYDDKIVSVNEVGSYEITDDRRVRELITAFSKADNLSCVVLATFREKFKEFSQKEYPLYLEYLVLTHEDIDFTSEGDKLKLHDEKRREYSRRFYRLEHSLKAASLGFFQMYKIPLFEEAVI